MIFLIPNVLKEREMSKLPYLLWPFRNLRRRKREIGKCPNCGLILRNIDIDEWKHVDGQLHQVKDRSSPGLVAYNFKIVQCPKCENFIKARHPHPYIPIILTEFPLNVRSDWEIISDPSPNPEGKSI